MVRVASGGCSIEVEVWELPASELGSFVAGIAAPLGLGKLELGDGRRETGFICEPCGLEGARDISHFGGWRQFLASQRAEDRSSGATSDQLAKRG
jgi:allophanate hydrolase